jgi:hypothetical protein
MFRRYMTSATLVVAIVGSAAMLAGCGSPPNSGVIRNIQAQFDSAPNFAGSANCPASTGAVLVEGRGIGTAFIGPVTNAVGTAAECSRGVILNKAGYHSPNTGLFSNCENNKYLTGKSWFDVHGTGTYTVDNGSVLYLVYHEHSESPFQADGKTIRVAPFTLHDCGFWQVDPNKSTGIFHGATGSGKILATVPVRLDYSSSVFATYDGKIHPAAGATPPAAPGAVACDKTMSGPIIGPVTVASGAVCSLQAASVNGGVTVDKGGTLLMQNSIARGDVVCKGCGAAASPKLCGAAAAACGGAVNFQNATTLGNLTVDGATNGSAILSSTIIKDLTYSNSSGSTLITGNFVKGSLTCNGNNPAPTVEYKPKGQTYTLSNYGGKSTGQCATSSSG